MSFSKAKLQRFNDIQSCTPSPADYNVSVKSHVAGAVIPKSGRFVEIQSPNFSENSSFLSSSSIPTFRTPNPPRKLKSNTSTDQKSNRTQLFPCPGDSLEALNEKIVECNNKDLFIQDLTEQLEEMKQQLSNLESEIEQLNSDKLQLQDEVSKLNKEHETAFGDLKIQYRQKLEDMEQTMSTITSRMNFMKQEYTMLKAENKRDLSEVLKNINTLEELYDTLRSGYIALVEEKVKDIKTKDEQIQQLENDLTNSRKDYDELQKKYQAIETEMVSYRSNMQNQLKNQKQNYIKVLKELELSQKAKIESMQSNFEAEKQNLREQSQLEVKQLTEGYKEASILAEMQATKKYDDCEATWKLKLQQAKQEADASLKEYQAIAECKVAQCKIEKNQALRELSEKNESLEALKSGNIELQAKYVNLEMKCQQVEVEFNNLKLELDRTRKSFDNESAANGCLIEQLKKDKYMYEVTISKTHKTVETLKKRLMCSDRDVEQLKAELEATEESKLEIEEKCNRLMDELQIVCGLCDDMEKQNRLAMQAAREDVLKVEHKLTSKVDEYKQQAEAEIQKARRELADVLEHLHEQQQFNESARAAVNTSEKELERLEQVNREQSSELARLAAVLASIQERETAQIQTDVPLVDENQRAEDLIAQTDKCECKLLKEENEGLRKKVAEQDALIGPFREHLEAYEMEYQALMGQKAMAEKEAKEMGMKYASILGHQNHKQKIKHLIDLKKKNYELCEENREMENKIRAQARTIEKLRKEMHIAGIKPKKVCSQAKDKENIGSPTTPLRDKN